jgi:hypothetical protein
MVAGLKAGLKEGVLWSGGDRLLRSGGMMRMGRARKGAGEDRNLILKRESMKRTAEVMREKERVMVSAFEWRAAVRETSQATKARRRAAMKMLMSFMS